MEAQLRNFLQFFPICSLKASIQHSIILEKRKVFTESFTKSYLHCLPIYIYTVYILNTILRLPSVGEIKLS